MSFRVEVRPPAEKELGRLSHDAQKRVAADLHPAPPYRRDGTPNRGIWYYEHPYPPGVKNYNKTKPIRIEEFDAEKKWWGKPGQENKRKETEFAWRVSIADIAARGYNLDVKNPHTVDDAHRDPAELLAEYQKAQAAVAEVREKLRRELETALTTKTKP